jgi:RNA polymerase sigma-70 factor (ECF subfamily)
VTFTDVIIRRTTPKPDLSDDELMGLVRRGDNGAFKVLYDRFKGQMFIYCLRMLDDRDAAKDALQEVFIRVHTHRDRYEAGTNFVGWIHTIARNLCLNARRDTKDQLPYDEAAEYNNFAPAEPESDVGLRDQLAREIQRLPEIYREVLILREYEERAYSEIAEITGLTMPTVKFRLFKAREILRARLAWSLDEFFGND